MLKTSSTIVSARGVAAPASSPAFTNPFGRAAEPASVSRLMLASVSPYDSDAAPITAERNMPTVPKVIRGTATMQSNGHPMLIEMALNSSYCGFCVHHMNDQYRVTSTEVINPDQEPGLSYNAFRMVTSAINVISNTTSTGTAPMAGTITAAIVNNPQYINFLGDIETAAGKTYPRPTLAPSTLPSQTSEETGCALREASLAAGAIVLGGPPLDRAIRLITNEVVDTSTARVNLVVPMGETFCPTDHDTSTAQYIFIPVSKLPPGVRGKFRARLNLGVEGAVHAIPGNAQATFFVTRTDGVLEKSHTVNVEISSTGMTNFYLDYLSCGRLPIREMCLLFEHAPATIRFADLVTSALYTRLEFEFFDPYGPEYCPTALMFISGTTAGQSITALSVQHLNVVPDSNLIANVKSNLPDMPFSEVEATIMAWQTGGPGGMGIKQVWRLDDYSRELPNLRALAGVDTLRELYNRSGRASGLGDLIRGIGGFVPGIGPILGGIGGSLVDSLTGGFGQHQPRQPGSASSGRATNVGRATDFKPMPPATSRLGMLWIMDPSEGSPVGHILNPESSPSDGGYIMVVNPEPYHLKCGAPLCLPYHAALTPLNGGPLTVVGRSVFDSFQDIGQFTVVRYVIGNCKRPGFVDVFSFTHAGPYPGYNTFVAADRPPWLVRMLETSAVTTARPTSSAARTGRASDPPLPPITLGHRPVAPPPAPQPVQAPVITDSDIVMMGHTPRDPTRLLGAMTPGDLDRFTGEWRVGEEGAIKLSHIAECYQDMTYEKAMASFKLIRSSAAQQFVWQGRYFSSLQLESLQDHYSHYAQALFRVSMTDDLPADVIRNCYASFLEFLCIVVGRGTMDDTDVVDGNEEDGEPTSVPIQYLLTLTRALTGFSLWCHLQGDSESFAFIESCLRVSPNMWFRLATNYPLGLANCMPMIFDDVVEGSMGALSNKAAQRHWLLENLRFSGTVRRPTPLTDLSAFESNLRVPTLKGTVYVMFSRTQDPEDRRIEIESPGSFFITSCGCKLPRRFVGRASDPDDEEEEIGRAASESQISLLATRLATLAEGRSAEQLREFARTFLADVEREGPVLRVSHGGGGVKEPKPVTVNLDDLFGEKGRQWHSSLLNNVRGSGFKHFTNCSAQAFPIVHGENNVSMGFFIAANRRIDVFTRDKDGLKETFPMESSISNGTCLLRTNFVINPESRDAADKVLLMMQYFSSPDPVWPFAYVIIPEKLSNLEGHSYIVAAYLALRGAPACISTGNIELAVHDNTVVITNRLLAIGEATTKILGWAERRMEGTATYRLPFILAQPTDTVVSFPGLTEPPSALAVGILGSDSPSNKVFRVTSTTELTALVRCMDGWYRAEIAEHTAPLANNPMRNPRKFADIQAAFSNPAERGYYPGGMDRAGFLGKVKEVYDQLQDETKFTGFRPTQRGQAMMAVRTLYQALASPAEDSPAFVKRQTDRALTVANALKMPNLFGPMRTGFLNLSRMAKGTRPAPKESYRMPEEQMIEMAQLMKPSQAVEETTASPAARPQMPAMRADLYGDATAALGPVGSSSDPDFDSLVANLAADPAKPHDKRRPRKPK